MNFRIHYFQKKLILLEHSVIVTIIAVEKFILPVRPLYPKDIESKDSVVSCCCLRNSSTAMPLNDDGCRNLLGIREIVPFSC